LRFARPGAKAVVGVGKIYWQNSAMKQKSRLKTRCPKADLRHGRQRAISRPSHFFPKRDIRTQPYYYPYEEQ
jgi:hypothetical protein